MSRMLNCPLLSNEVGISSNSIKDPAKVSFRATPLPASETISRPPPTDYAH